MFGPWGVFLGSCSAAFFRRLSSKRMSVSQQSLTPDVLNKLQKANEVDNNGGSDKGEGEGGRDDGGDGEIRTNKRGSKNGKNGKGGVASGKRSGKIKKGLPNRGLHMFDTPGYWKSRLQGLLNKA